LITKGYVKKETCKKDRRLVDVIISPKGLSTLERIDRRQQEMDDILQNLSEEEASTLTNLLDKVRQVSVGN